MSAGKYSAIVLLIAIIIISAGSPLCAGNPLVEEFPDYEGWINWEYHVVKAIGRGVLPGDVEFPEQARALARNQSVVIARRNLAMTIGSLRVDADTKVSDLAAASDTVREKIDKLIRSAKLVSIKQIYDCSFEAILQVNIPGDNGLIAALIPDINKIDYPKADIEPERSICISVPNTYQPVLFPRMYDNKGKLIFDISFCHPRSVIRHGMIEYRLSQHKTRPLNRPGKQPVIIIADKSSVGSDIVLNQADAAKLSKNTDQLAKYGISVLVADR